MPLTPTTLSVNMTRNGVISNKVYLTVPFSVYGYLRTGGVGISGKTITVTYNGASLGAATTDGSGRFDLVDETLSPPSSPASYILLADFAGDATYAASQDGFSFTLSRMPTKMSQVTGPSDFPEDQYAVFRGWLVNNVPNYIYTGYGIASQLIYLKVDGIVKAADTTDASGHFKLAWIFDDAGTYSITVDYVQTNLYAASASPATTLTVWSFNYPQPEDVEEGCYGWVLCIDPNAVRGGPIYYLLDGATVLPGLTGKSGSFSATLNDNEREFLGFTRGDMYLLGDDKPFILDQDEYWIGLQRGAGSRASDPSADTWDPSGGTDGKGAGRYWIMGGYITKRYYSRAEKGRVTATIMGKDYMDVWKDQHFGTGSIPRSYEVPATLDIIANDMLLDINTLQGLDYEFATSSYWSITSTTLMIDVSYGDTRLSVSSTTGFNIGDVIRIRDDDDAAGEEMLISNIGVTYFDVTTPVQNAAGYSRLSAVISGAVGTFTEEWQREFVDDNPFNIMEQICSEAVMEWRINHLKQVMLYLKTGAPQATSYSLRYTSNIRDVPEIVLGDTDDIVTDAIVKDGYPYTVPPSISQWMTAGLWNEVTDFGMIIYNPVVNPYPPNPIRKIYTDSTLTLDDEGYVALCFQHQGTQPSFQVHLGYWLPAGPGSSTEDGARLDLDLRAWRRIKLSWRHLTRNIAAPGNTRYWLRLHTGFNDLFRFAFGEGTQEDSEDSNNDTISTQNWTPIDLLLPEPDVDGTIDYADASQMKGWLAVGTPDPTEINWVSLSVELDEADPGYAVTAGKALTAAGSTGEQYISVNNPENLAGYPNGITSRRGLNRPVHSIIIEGATEEKVEVIMVYPDTSTPAGRNILLQNPLNNNFTTSAKLYVLAGKTFCMSQLHFERNFQKTGQNLPTIGPRRYRIYGADELKYQSETDGKVEAVLNLDTLPRRYVKIRIDGDPEKEIGTLVRVYLDPTHNQIFQNTLMIIDNVEYRLQDVDLEQTLTLTPTTTSIKPRDLTTVNAMNAVGWNLQKIARRGITPWK